LRVVAYCEACRHRHGLDFDPFRQTNEFADWRTKHLGHAGVGFAWPERSTKPGFVDYFRRAWRYFRHPTRPGLVAEPTGFTDRLPDGIAAFVHNADAKITYAASAAVTFTSVASLATSSTKLAGAESNSVTNVSNKYLDYAVSGILRVGTTPTTAKSLDVCLVGTLNNTPTWPDVFDGTDSAETVTNQEIKDQICKPVTTISIISTTSNVDYPYGPASVASRFGGQVPNLFDLFVAHDMVAALNATQGSPAFVTGSYITIA
jgi:hypothetical protein